MIEILERSSPGIMGFRMSGKLSDADYQTFVPAIDAELEQREQLRLLAVFEDFQGWDLHALWDDMKFGISHYSNIERIAMVGEHAWQEWMTRVCKPFTAAEVKYFDISELDAAWAWVEGD